MFSRRIVLFALTILGLLKYSEQRVSGAPNGQTSSHEDVIYEGCGVKKHCLGEPVNCIESRNCKAVVAVSANDDKYIFELQGSGNPKYVATALSMDNKMGDDSAMECVRMENGDVKLYTSWTYPKIDPYVRRSDSPQNIVQLLESSIINQKLYCKFSRDAVSTVKGHNFDLAKNKYNLLIVAGNTMKDADRVGFHDAAYRASGEPHLLAKL